MNFFSGPQTAAIAHDDFFSLVYSGGNFGVAGGFQSEFDAAILDYIVPIDYEDSRLFAFVIQAWTGTVGTLVCLSSDSSASA